MWCIIGLARTHKYNALLEKNICIVCLQALIDVGYACTIKAHSLVKY